VVVALEEEESMLEESSAAWEVRDSSRVDNGDEEEECDDDEVELCIAEEHLSTFCAAIRHARGERPVFKVLPSNDDGVV